jgi:hypothetical protein
VYVITTYAGTHRQDAADAVDPRTGLFQFFHHPGTFVATLKPRHLRGLVAQRKTIQVHQGQTTTFRIAYGRS